MAGYARVGHSLLFLTLAASAADFTIVDVQKVPASGDAATALVHITVPANPAEVSCDILIAGAGMGGVSAAITASKRGQQVCLLEETDWIGGQATAGGVSALDENRFIEISGGTRTYVEFRRGIRDYYRTHYQLSPVAAAWENLNPGSCYVSPLCYEPKVGVAVLEAMLRRQPVKLYLRTQIFSLEHSEGKIVSALAWQFDKKTVLRIRPKFVLDATEMGDLLPLAKIPHVVGSEPKSQTGEPHAAAAANKACVQSFTYPFVIERRPGEQHSIARPEGYESILKRQDFTLRVNYPTEYGWKGTFQYKMYGEDPPVPNNMSPGPFFNWRRLLAARNFAGGSVPNDVALMNWPRQDYAAESLLDRTAEEQVAILQRAKLTSLAFLYWLQHDLPRDDGKGRGYPELLLRADEMQTADGLSKYPYIRESRRIIAQGRVVEQDIVDEYQSGPRARWFADSIGTGFYMVDIHPCGANEKGHMMMPKPFQIPMSAMMQTTVSNFLPAGKNLGVTHLTNGAFRLHPVEWNVGEAAGMIASLTLTNGAKPDSAAVQRELARAGVPLAWFDDLSVDHPDFAAIHLAAMRGVYPMESNLHASPDAPVTRKEAAAALAAYFGEKLGVEEAVAYAVKNGWMAVDHRNWFHGDLLFYWTDWREERMPRKLPGLKMVRTGPVRRAELARRLFGE